MTNEPVLSNDADDQLNPSEAHSSGVGVTTDPLSGIIARCSD